MAKKTLLLSIAYLGFVSLGLPDTVTGVAWPSLRDTFGLAQGSLGLISVCCGVGYLCSSFFAGQLSTALGIGLLLAASSGLMALSGCGHAASPAWPVFLCFAVVGGLGSGAIDGGLNMYVASHFSARHVNWLHASYSLGATCGPLLMTAAVVRAESWRGGYAALGGIMLALAVLFAATIHYWEPAAKDAAEQPASGGIGQALKHPLVWLQIAIFAVYTGLELTIGAWSYTLFTESRGVPQSVAGPWVAAYFGAIGGGRLALGFLAERIGVDRLVRLGTLTAIAGALLLTISSPAAVGMAGLLAAGLGLAPVFPCLMARTPQRLGPALARHAIGFQVSAAMVGAATMPALGGILIENFGLPTIAWFVTALAALLWSLHESLLRRGVASNE